MNAYEEELQRSIEVGKSPAPDGIDAQAYRQVFSSVSKPSGFSLPSDFAQKVMAKITAQAERKSLLRDMMWLIGGLLVIVTGFVLAVMLSGLKLNLNFLTGFDNIKGILVFGVIMVVFFNWIEKRLLRKQKDLRGL